MALQPVTIGADRLERLLGDPDWCLQQKYDGVRCVVTCSAEVLYVAGRTGDPPSGTFAAAFDAIEAEFPLDTDYTLDGELAWGHFYPFDELTCPDRPYLERLTRACELADRWRRPHIRRVRTWRSEPAKRAALDRARAQRVEGVILRRLSAPWTDGECTGAAVRFKFVQRADVIVDGVTRRRSFHAALLNPESGQLVRCGKVPLRTAADLAAVERALQGGGPPIAEVEYLYASHNGQLVQARFIRSRTDKPAWDCTVSQLVTTKANELDTALPATAAVPAASSPHVRGEARRPARPRRGRPDRRTDWAPIIVSAIILLIVGFICFVLSTGRTSASLRVRGARGPYCGCTSDAAD